MLLYQEQVMQASQVLAGFTGGQSETLMKAMSKKQAEAMAKMKPLFIEGCLKNGINPSASEDIFGRMEEFAKYAFNKSHAAYYGLVSYWTAFLKVNYPSEFMACKMTSLLEKKDKLLVVIDDCRKHDIEVLPADVNESNHEFTVVEGGIRFGLQAIKGIGEAPVNAICEARKEGGKFSSLFDFCARVPPRACGKGAIETLIKCGAFDSIHANRQAMIDALDGAISAGLQAQQDAASGQFNMFGEATETGRPKASGQLPNVPDADRDTRLGWEKEFLGLYISDHPLLPLREYLEQNTTALERIGEDRSLSDGSRVTVGGMVTTVKKMIDKNGRTWAAFTLEDLTGSLEVLAFSKTFEKCGQCVEEDAKLVVTGRLAADNRRGGFRGGGDDDDTAAEAENTVYKVMADDIEVIDKAEAAQAAENAVSTRENIVTPHEEAAMEGAAAPSISINRSTAGVANGSANGHAEYSNGNGHNGNGSNGHNGSNGNGANGGYSNGQSNGNGHANGSGSASSEYSRSAAQIIGRTFAPPYDAGHCVHLYISEGRADASTLSKLWNACRNHRGDTEVWLHIDNGLEMMQLRVSPSFWVDPTPEFCEEIYAVLGQECVQMPCAPVY
jgi:DNA polymerase III alpha subunit